jgi:DNA-binding CsgD family transcriptional regulator
MVSVNEDNIISELFDEEYTRILDSISDFTTGARISIAVTAGRGMGKTTLLRRIYNEIDKMTSQGIKAILINGSKIANTEDLIDTLCTEAGFNSIPRFKLWKDQASELLTIMSKGNLKYVIIIDDAHFIKNNELIGFLRNEYQGNSNLLFLFGVESEYTSIISSYANAFYGQFNTIKLSGLSMNQSINFITKLTESTGADKLDNGTLELIAKIAEGNIAILRMVSLIATATLEKDSSNLKSFYSNTSDFLNMLYEPQISPQAMAILKELSTDEFMTASQISKKLGIAVAGIISQLKRMMDKGIVIKKPNGLYKTMNFIKVMFHQQIGST